MLATPTSSARPSTAHADPGLSGSAPHPRVCLCDRNRRYQLNRTLVPISVRVKQGNKLLRGDVGWNVASAAPSGR
jgi:hypothetical protein